MYAVDTLIGDITPESLMKTLTDRKIAQEQETTYETQRKHKFKDRLLKKKLQLQICKQKL
jgi:hypothetical protein